MEDDLEGVSVGSLGHILKKTFKELYLAPAIAETTVPEDSVPVKEAPTSEPETDEAVGNGENVDGAGEDASNDIESDLNAADEASIASSAHVQSKDVEGVEPGPNEGEQPETLSEPETSAQPEALADAEAVDEIGSAAELVASTDDLVDRPEGVEEVREIERRLAESSRQATQLERYLEQQRVAAVAADDAESRRLYDKGLLMKAEYPRGRSHLVLDPVAVESFGVFGSSLILAKQLMQDNEATALYRRGQAPSRGLDKAYQLRASTPNYLRSTHTQEVRVAMNSERHEKTRLARGAGSAQAQTLDFQTDFGANFSGLEDDVDGATRLAQSEGKTVSSTRGGKVRKRHRVKNKRALHRPNVEEREANEKILRRMHNQATFLVNPRFRDERTRRKNWKVSLKNADSTEPKEQPSVPTPDCAFHVEPARAEFTSYSVGGLYSCTLKLNNVSRVSRRVRVLPPTTPYFSISLVGYPCETGTVAPGLSAVVTIRFCPDSLADYADFITVQTELGNFRVELDAHRPPPSLTIPLELDCGCCLVGNRSTATFSCANYGGPGRFRLLPASEWPNPSSVEYTYTEIAIPPFIVSPAEFELNTNDSIELRIAFLPEGSGDKLHEREFVMICDNCQVKTFTVKGTSCQVHLEISAMDDAVIDLGAANVRQPESLLFGKSTPGAVVERVVRVQNRTPIELPFHWSLFNEVPRDSKRGSASSATPAGMSSADAPVAPRRTSLVPVRKSKGAEGIFSITPSKGVFPPAGSMQFTVCFRPSRCCDFRQASRLVIESIPPASVESFKMRRRRGSRRNSRSHVSATSHAALAEPGAVTGMLSLPEGSAVSHKHGESHSSEVVAGNALATERCSEYSDTDSALNTARSALSSVGAVGGLPEDGGEAPVQLMNIPVMKLRLRGAACEANIQITPTVLYLAGELLPSKTYMRTVTATNHSAAAVNYAWQPAAAIGWPAAAPPPEFSLMMTPNAGIIGAGKSAEFTLEFTPRCVGNFELDVAFVAPNGPPGGTMVRVRARVVGPSVRIDAPEIDFGLVGVGEIVDHEISFTNLSDTPAMFRFCVAGVPELPWPVAAPDVLELQSAQGEGSSSAAISPAPPPAGAVGARGARTRSMSPSCNQPLRVAVRGSGNAGSSNEASAATLPSVSTMGSPIGGAMAGRTAPGIDRCRLLFEPAVGVLAPLQSRLVRVQCSAGWKPERLREVLECRVRDAPSQFARVRGEIQSPKVFIDTTSVDLGVTYVTVPFTRKIQITNVSNLPAHFAWSEIGGNSSYYEATFSEQRGTLHAKQVKTITFSYKALKAKQVRTLFVCDVEGMQAPLGFSFRTVSKGLVVTYSIVDAGVTEDAMAPEMPKVDGDNATSKKHATVAATKIPMLDFGDDVRLTHRRTLRLCLQNHSAIRTNYALSVKECPAHVLPPSLGGKAPPPASSTLTAVSGGMDAAGVLATRGSRASLSSGIGSAGAFGTRRLGDRHERTAVFASAAGSAHINRRLQSNEDREVLGEGKADGGRGVAFLAVRPSGVLPPWSAVIVDVVCFNNMPGRYKDELVAEVEGLPATRIPIKTRVVGSPLELSTNTIGLNVHAKPWPELRWGDVVHSTHKVTKTLRVVNNGPVDARLVWHVKAQRPPDADLVNLTLVTADPCPPSVATEAAMDDESTALMDDLVQLSVTPHRDIVKPPPFEVWPQARTVPAHGSAAFQVTFLPTEIAGLSKALMVADGEWLYKDGSNALSANPSLSECSVVSSAGPAGTRSRGATPSASPVPSDTGESVASAVVATGGTQLPIGSMRAASKLVKRSRAERDPMKKCLRLSLSAKSIDAALKLDRAVRVENGMQYLEFVVTATNPHDHKSYFKSVSLTNKTAALLPCFVRATPPFTIHSSNTPSMAHSLTSAQIAALLPADVQDRFRPRRTSEKVDVNERLRSVHRGALTVHFANGTTQLVNLEGVVTRPMVLVKPSTHDFGPVHTEGFQRTTLYVTNPTVDSAKWSLEHVKNGVGQQNEIDDPGSRFRFVVKDGVGFDVLLSGEGSYEEPHDTTVIGLPRPAQAFEVYD